MTERHKKQSLTARQSRDLLLIFGRVDVVNALKGPPFRRGRRPFFVTTETAMQPQFTRGDSVQLLPSKEIGIVYRPADDRGELIVQVQGQKLRVNAERVHLLVPASSLYPDNYDFSIIEENIV